MSKKSLLITGGVVIVIAVVVGVRAAGDRVNSSAQDAIVDDYAFSAANRSSVERLRADSLTITGAKLKGKIYPIPTNFSVTMPNIQMNDLGKSGNGLIPG